MEDISKVSKSISIEGRGKVMTLAERLIQEGRQEGRQEEQLKTANKLLKMGLSLSKVAEATELSLKEIEHLNKELTI